MEKITSKFLPIALTFDIEKYDFDNSINKSKIDSWAKILNGIKKVIHNLEQIELQEDINLCATWFIRCDNEVMSEKGERGYILEEYKNVWKDLSKKGHEIAFHPHLYSLQNNVWRQDMNQKEQLKQIKDSYRDFLSKGFVPKSSKIGDAYSSNQIMKALNDLGIEFDCTAMPGRIRKDNARQIDWGITSNVIYNPSYEDYRIEGEENYKILEIPMTMLPTKADYDNENFFRYLDLSFHSRVFVEGFEKLVTNTKYILATMHPSTILENNYQHGLLSFRSDVFFTNLSNLIKACKKNLIEYKFVRVKDLIDFR